MEFKWNQWHHGYLGFILILMDICWFQSGWLFWVAIVLVLDEISQIIWFGQYGGLLHWLYIKTLYKIPIIKKFNIWMDGLFK